MIKALYRNMLALMIVLVLIAGSNILNAETITITTNSTVTAQPSYTFGNWIFELVTPTNTGFNLINSVPDFIVSNAAVADDFTLRRLDNAPFSLLSLVYAGQGITTVGGVDLTGPGSPNFQSFNFSGQSEVTNVASVLFNPTTGNGSTFFQLAAFETSSAVPEPTSLLLLGTGLGAIGLAAWRRRK